MELGVGELAGLGRVMAGAASGRDTRKIAPVTSHKLHGEPCTGLAFCEEGADGVRGWSGQTMDQTQTREGVTARVGNEPSQAGHNMPPRSASLAVCEF